MAQHTDTPEAPRQAITPMGINHLVLNVRNMDESHAFWTEMMGFKQVGELHPRPDRPNPPNMRFYSGDHQWQAQSPRPRPGRDARPASTTGLGHGQKPAGHQPYCHRVTRS